MDGTPIETEHNRVARMPRLRRFWATWKVDILIITTGTITILAWSLVVWMSQR